LYECSCQLAQSTNTKFHFRTPFKLRELPDNDEAGSKKAKERNKYPHIYK